MAIVVEYGDITKIVCDAIVNPANSYGYMGGGVAGAIKRIGGIEIENEAISLAPIPIGKAIVTTAGSLPCQHVIHAPTMKEPAMRINIDNVKLATRAALKLAEDLKIKSIAIPGMGTGVGGVSLSDAAREMVTVAREFEDKFEKIVFIGINNDLIEAFKIFI